MATLTKAIQAKNEKTLAERFRYSGVIRTRAEQMQFLKAQGAFSFEAQVRKVKAEETEREYLKRNSFNIPFGNEMHPATIAYNRRKNLLLNGFFKTEYRIYKDSQVFNVVTKTEFDYFNQL